MYTQTVKVNGIAWW